MSAPQDRQRNQTVSGYWYTTITLRAHLRLRSYLVSARGHGIRAIDTIHAALIGTPWLPATVMARGQPRRHIGEWTARNINVL
jgi:hypothetical protein